MTHFHRRRRLGFTLRPFGPLTWFGSAHHRSLRAVPSEVEGRQTQGFTLIELTLVTLLVLIIAGLSTPLFKKTLSDLSARNTSFSICKLINYAQEMAVLERVNYKIAFDFKRGSYQLLELSSSAKPPAYKKVTGRFGKLCRLPQGLSLSGSRSGIIFYSDGHCDDINVNVLTSSGGYSIMVKGFGNMVEIKPFDRLSVVLWCDKLTIPRMDSAVLAIRPEPVEGRTIPSEVEGSGVEGRQKLRVLS